MTELGNYLGQLLSPAINYDRALQIGQIPVHYIECTFPGGTMKYVTVNNRSIGFSDAAHAIKFETSYVQYANDLAEFIRNIFSVIPGVKVEVKLYQNIV